MCIEGAEDLVEDNKEVVYQMLIHRAEKIEEINYSSNPTINWK